MCGIFGISYGPQGPEGEQWTPTEMAQLMFPAIVHRGPHSFGWFTYSKNDGIEFDKHPGKVTDPGQLDKVALNDNARYLVGHVRYATTGDPADNINNHPVVHGRYIGVHNGVIRNYQDILDETGRDDTHGLSEVDSEAIFAAVNKWGVEKGLARIRGDMVSVFTNTRQPNTLYIARAIGRPLVYATTKAGSLIWASELDVILATGIEVDNVVEWKGKYRVMKVRQGQIVERAQYRAEPAPEARPAKWTPSPALMPSRIPVESGGVHGITDYFASQRSSLDPPRTPRHNRTVGTRVGDRDEFGGEYLGAGWYRAGNGRTMTITQYVSYVVEQQALVLDAAAMAADAEAQAQAVISNNT